MNHTVSNLETKFFGADLEKKLLSGAESLSQCQTFRQIVPPFASSAQQSEAWFNNLLILNMNPPPHLLSLLLLLIDTKM